MTKIGKGLGIHREEVKRNIRKALSWFVDNYETPNEENGTKT